MITISEHFVVADMEYESDGTRPRGYKAFNASGKGRPIATVAGRVELVRDGNADMAKLDGKTYALRDILTFARAGERGLSVL